RRFAARLRDPSSGLTLKQGSCQVGCKWPSTTLDCTYAWRRCLARLTFDEKTQRSILRNSTSAPRGLRRPRGDLELLHLEVQAAAVEAELAGRIAEVPVVGGQSFHDVAALETGPGLAKRERAFLVGGCRGDVEDLHQVRVADHFLGHQDHHPLHEVARLAHVP